jgi:AraC-like DNA-binding protein
MTISSIQPHQSAELSAFLPEMARRVRAAAPLEGLNASAWPALSLLRADRTATRIPSVYEPSLCVVVQGSKQAMVGDERFQYDAGQFLVVSLTLPVIAHITEASADEPYLCLRLDIDPVEIAELLLSMPTGVSPSAPPGQRGLYLAPMSEPLADVLLRLLRLLDKPEELPVLAPMLVREVYFRVLGGPLGERLRDLVDGNGHARRIARAIELIKRRIQEPLRVPALADALHMSTSSLHHRFKQLTAMTPVQYQKQLRLHEARRLMLNDGLGAAQAGHRVGYGSPSQFSRDYRRLFGASPRRSLGLASTG